MKSGIRLMRYTPGKIFCLKNTILWFGEWPVAQSVWFLELQRQEPSFIWRLNIIGRGLH